MQATSENIITLFQQIYEGSREAYNLLFSAYYNKLVSFARQYTENTEDAEEIVSELFVTLWLRKSTLPTIGKPEVYLFVCVKNACLNMLRRRKRRETLFQAHIVNNFDEQEMAVDEERELIRILREAVNDLPRQRRMIFKLIKEDGFKSKQVAEILDLSTRTVENQLYKAVKTLADVLAPYLGYHPQKKTGGKLMPPVISAIFF